jgi:hypothetical protein
MTYLLALLAAIVGGAIGATLGVIIAGTLAPIMGISSFEGAAGYFAVFIGGPLGGLAGLVLGAVAVLRWRGRQSAGGIAGGLGVVVIGVALVAAAALGMVYYLSLDTVNPNGPAPQLAFEIKLPAGASPPGGSERPIELQAGKDRMPALMQRAATRDDGGRPVIVGMVEMYHRSSQRMLVMTMPDKTDVLFNIKLAGAPKHSPEFSAWQRADYIAEPGKEQSRRATAADNYEIRYRADWGEEN